MAKSHAAKGHVAKARHFYLLVLTKYPQNKKAKKGLETLELKAARENQPLVEWQKSDLARQEFSDLTALYSAGKLNEALKEASRLCQVNPAVPLLHNTLGDIHVGLGKLNAAVASYERAVELKPDYVEAHYNLGNALRDLGQLDAAVVSCGKALELEPGYAEAHSNLGVTLNNLGQLEAAIASCERALKIKPDYAEAWNNLFFPVKALDLSATSKNAWVNAYKKEINEAVLSNAHFSVLEYRLNAFTPHTVEDSFNYALTSVAFDN